LKERSLAEEEEEHWKITDEGIEWLERGRGREKGVTRGRKGKGAK
jgi:hypothetical protein